MPTYALSSKCSLSEMPEAQLVQTYQQDRQPQPLSELYRRYFDRVFKYCLKLCKNQEVASDLTQDVFLKVAEHLGELRNPDLFPAWLFRIAHNRFINYTKASSLSAQLVSSEADHIDDPEENESAMEREVLFQKILGVLDEIPEMDRELLVAKYFHKESIHGLEARYGLSESAVKMRLARARQRMAKMCY